MSLPLPIYDRLTAYGLEATQRRLDERLSARPSGCIEATGARNLGGYVPIRIGGKALMAHRIAWALANRAEPGNLLVCHRCDNPPCCNPDHLFLGTTSDNTRDMITKGRRPYIDRHHRVRGPRLTAEQAARIRFDTRPHKLIAAEYGITTHTVVDIRTGRTWTEAGRDRKRAKKAVRRLNSMPHVGAYAEEGRHRNA